MNDELYLKEIERKEKARQKREAKLNKKTKKKKLNIDDDDEEYTVDDYVNDEVGHCE